MRSLVGLNVAVITVLLGNLFMTNVAIAEDNYPFAVLPRFFSIVIFERFGPLADYIAEKAEIDVEFVMGRDFADHIDMVGSGKAQISYQDPVVFAHISEQVIPLAIASKGKNGTRFRGIIIVQSDGGIHNITDLKGKSVSIVSLQSAGGYISQKNYLAENGINVKIDMIIKETEDNKQENVILDVYSKKTDVGFIRESALNRVDKAIDSNKIKVLAQTSWLPNWVFTVHKSVSKDVGSRIQKALLSLPAKNKILVAAQLSGFVEPDLDELEKVREMVLNR